MNRRFSLASMTMFLLGLISSGNAAAEEVDLQALKNQVDALTAALEQKNESKTTIGGYGEHHLNNLDGNDKDQIDAHRFVLFVNHQYTDTLKFFSELELEHSLAGDGKPGEVELEQAYIEKTLKNDGRVSMGLFLLPVGFLNETHEPDTFYGVERNNVEKNIIPTTWWETGVMYSQTNESFSYDLAVHSALKTFDDPATLNSIRSGRQKSAEADGNEPAVTARISTRAIDGLELALSYQYQSDLSGGLELDADASLVVANANWQIDRFGVKALYALWDVDDQVDALVSGYSEQSGYMGELSYKFNDDIGVFTRYSEWDNAAGDDVESAVEQVDVGVNYWLHERVVIKADFQMQTDKATDAELDGLNLGLGWSF